MKKDDLQNQINKSGFPFQLGVEAHIKKGTSEHGWTVLSREHPWTNPETNNTGFADIILAHIAHVTFRLIIECKRNRSDDQRQLRWIFLCPDESDKLTNLTSCFEVDASLFDGVKQIRVWDNIPIDPSSFQAEFCILPNDESRKSPIIEALCQELIESAEGIAEEELRVADSQQISSTRLFIFCAIVTNAKLFTCNFKSDDVDLKEGTIADVNSKLKEVPFIRFRKSISTEFPTERVHSLKDSNKARERSVFIVNSECLTEFLKDWKIDDRHRFAIQILSDR